MEAIVRTFLTLFIVVVGTIPWWLILFHYLAPHPSKTVRKVSYYGVIGVWVVLAFFAFQHQDFFFELKFVPNMLTRGLGIIFIILAGIIDWNVIKTLGLKRLAMVPELKQEKISEDFVATGIYHYSRHPRYVEYMLISIAAGLFFGYLFMFGFLVYLLASYWWATRAEEAELIKRFGEPYREYQKKVPRFFIF